MIFAHGPLGALTAWAFLRSRARWQARSVRLPQRRLLFFLSIGFLGGLFPDVDLFYYYLINASNFHRAYITHTPIVYVGVLLLGVIIQRQRRRSSMAVWIFIFGALSHLVTDAVGSEIMFLYPFSRSFFGLVDLRLSEHLVTVNLIMEGVWSMLFGLMCLRIFFPTSSWRGAARIFLVLLFCIGVGGVILIDRHTVHGPKASVFGDDDRDGEVNAIDRDRDGDGTLNIHDIDANDDGTPNTKELSTNALRFDGVWMDPTNGHMLQIPLRIGFVTNHDAVLRLFSSIGIMFTTEMAHDFQENPDGYVGTPADVEFDLQSDNIITWLTHQDLWETDVHLQNVGVGDVLFFDHDYFAIITSRVGGDFFVLDVFPGRPVEAQRPLADVMDDMGPPRGRGMVLRAVQL